jgi:hypothetical protein
MRFLSRREVVELLGLTECIAAVERAFLLHAEGRTLGPGVPGVPAGRGGFHIKAAGLVGERRYFAAKTNANFPDNPQRFGLPTIRGTVVLADAENGEPLALMDSHHAGAHGAPRCSRSVRRPRARCHRGRHAGLAAGSGEGDPRRCPGRHRAPTPLRRRRAEGPPSAWVRGDGRGSDAFNSHIGPRLLPSPPGP